MSEEEIKGEDRQQNTDDIKQGVWNSLVETYDAVEAINTYRLS